MTATVTTTVRMVNCVHHNTAHTWALALVTVTAGFTDLYVLVLLVADGTDRSRAGQKKLADFAAGHAHLSVVPLFGHEHRAITSTPDCLCTAARFEFERMYGGTDWDVSQS